MHASSSAQPASRRPQRLFDLHVVREAGIESLKKLGPLNQAKNPVMFVVYVVSILTSGSFVQALVGRGEAPAAFILAIALCLWFTVIFANFAEAMAEGRGKAQAESLRRARRDVRAKRLSAPDRGARTTDVS